MKLLFSFDVAPINMSVSLIDIETKKIIHWELFSIKASTMELSCMKLIQKLTELYEKYKDNELIILHEDQPRCNKKTVQIAGQIQMYFCLKKLENKNVKKIEGIHPRHKITYYVKMPNDEELPIERLAKMKKGHYKNKQILIEHAKRILIHNNETTWADFFKNSKKKDDLADSYVQGLFYIKTKVRL